MVASLSPSTTVSVVSRRIEAALDRLADDPELRARPGDNAKATAVRQDLDWVRTKLFDAYDVARERAIADGVTAILAHVVKATNVRTVTTVTDAYLPDDPHVGYTGRHGYMSTKSVDTRRRQSTPINSADRRFDR